jgi:hypothetical protein
MAPVANYPGLEMETAFLGRVAFPLRPSQAVLRVSADWDFCYADMEQDKYTDKNMHEYPLKPFKGDRWVLFALWFNTYRWGLLGCQSYFISYHQQETLFDHYFSEFAGNIPYRHQ